MLTKTRKKIIRNTKPSIKAILGLVKAHSYTVDEIEELAQNLLNLAQERRESHV